MLESAFKAVQSRMYQACEAAGREKNTVRLVAVSKKQPLEKIETLFNLGQIWFGENYIQELEAKKQKLSHLSIKWSYIGKIQSNKIKKMVMLADEIQTVSSLEEAIKIDSIVARCAKAPYPIYLSVNFEKEPSKSGANKEDAVALAFAIEKLQNIQLQGMMVIPPQEASLAAGSGAVPDMYQQIAELAKKIGKGHLSLGMSHDLEAAIQVGATTVRVGQSLMGERSL